jgi:hypothetical protein
MVDCVGHLLGRIRDGANDPRTIGFRRPRRGQLMRRGNWISCGERVQQQNLSAYGNPPVPDAAICAERDPDARNHEVLPEKPRIAWMSDHCGNVGKEVPDLRR